MLLAIALFAYYGKRLTGTWRWIYVVTAIVSLYFNVFVLVIQSFIKVAALNALAPTQSNEPAFVVAQALVLALFVLMGIIAAVKFRPLTLA